MFRLIKSLICGIMILDVAILPFGCGSRIRETANKYEVYINYIYTNEDEKIISYVDRRYCTKVEKGELLYEQDVLNSINDYFENNSVYLYVDENTTTLINVTKYNLEKVSLYTHNYQENHIGKELALPYEFNYEEDKITYFEGIRGAYIINVHVNIEYEVVPQDNYEK